LAAQRAADLGEIDQQGFLLGVLGKDLGAARRRKHHVLASAPVRWLPMP